MLSQKEVEYLRSPESFDAAYAYVLKHKIKTKIRTLDEELALLRSAGLLNLTENSKNLTDFSKNQQMSNKLNSSGFSQKVVGLERFELSSIAPEATSLDHASRQPLF